MGLFFGSVALSGCANGGYAGGGIMGFSSSSIVLNAGQTYPITATVAENPHLTWALAGASCSGSACGTISASTGAKVTYAAPQGVTSQLPVTLTATVVNTSDSQAVQIAVNPDPAITGVLPAGVVGHAYSGKLNVTGGTAPIALSIASGALPPGLIFDISTGAISGTPTAAGTFNFAVQATDSSVVPDTVSAQESITVSTAPLALTASTLPGGTVGTPYNNTIGVTGGTAPYTCTLISGNLPASLQLNNCTVSGTPSVAGSSTFNVKVTDAGNPMQTAMGPETIVIAPPAPLNLKGLMPAAYVNQPYTYNLAATGGIQPYSYAVTTGALPAGIALAADGSFTGTPTAPGASSFTVTVTDSENPAQTASLPLILTVNYAATPGDSQVRGPYAFLFQGFDDSVVGAVDSQSAAVGSFTADGMGGVSAGELDANDQNANPTGTTVSTQNFVGTYAVNPDNTGSLTLTTLNADGTTNATTTYSVTFTAPVPPSTISTRAGLIEFDNNQLTGSRGSGTLLAQTSASFSAGLSGSYAFGISGDTPCLLTCQAGVVPGPAASVGQVTFDGNGASSGAADASLGSTNYPNAAVSGGYLPADQNGRVQMTIANPAVTNGEYPVDFAAYIVNANEFLLVSTDKHASYVLLSGTAQRQTSASFSNLSLSGPFIGYENAQTDPGLLGTTIQNTANYSTATIFRSTADGAGNCDVTNVDSAGLANEIDNIPGLTNQSTLEQALAGSSEATGAASCTVSSSGRGELDYPQPTSETNTLLGLLDLPTGPPAPRVFYLTAPGTGYFLETGYAGLGFMQTQTGAPFSLATFSGAYVEGSIPAASFASTDNTGTLTADGNGNVTYTENQNVDAGTINALKNDQTTNTTYALSDPNSATPAQTGRYLLGDGTTVIYVISPQNFVLLNTSAEQASPSVSLLY